MQQEVRAIGDNEIEEMLSALTSDYGMTSECLSRLLGVNCDLIRDYRKYKDQMPTGLERCSFMNLLAMLYFTTNDEPDFRFKAFLEVLIEFHKISANTIAKFAKIRERDVLDFISDSRQVPIEKKYRLASVVMMLRLIFKTVEPKI
jgi:hypothetical protein